MNYKVVSSKQVIAKIFRDLKPDNGSFVISAIEWIGEALEFIGVHAGMEKRWEDIEIRNFRGHLPCDLQFIGMVEYKGAPLFYGSDPRTYALPHDPDAFMNPHAEYTTATYFKADVEGGNQASFKQVKPRTEGSDFYVLNPGVIQTSFPEGEVRMHYLSIPVDGEFYPMVPDNVIVKEAIEWYVIRQMMFGGYKHPYFSFPYVDGKWEKTLGQAQNDLMFPNIDKVESFKRMWVTMIPRIHTYDEFFHDR